jgi:hypothetical protein
MTNPTPHKLSEPSLIQMSDGPASLRASVNKFARAQTALLSNVNPPEPDRRTSYCG